MPDPLFSDEEQRPADTSLPSSFTIGEIHPSPLIFRFLHRLRLFWFEILPRKFRLIFTCIALGFFNLTNRLVCFFQRRNSSSMNDPLISSQEDFNHSLDRNSIWTRSNISQPSLPSDKMAHMLVQQQRQPAILRSPSITIHRPSNKNSQENSLPAVHSVDERLFLCKHDSTRLIHLLTRFASEPQMPVCHIQSANIFDFQPTKASSINNTTSKPALQFDLDEINFDEIFQFNCDKPSTNDSSPAPVPVAPEEPAEPVSEPPSTSSENPINGSVEDDTLVDVSPNGPSDINDVHGERHFRRRKRRSSLTKTSISSDDSAVAPLIDSTENIQLSSTSSDTVELNPPPPSSPATPSAPTEPTPIPSATVVDEQEIQENEEKSAPLSRYRGRRLRHRFYRQANATMPVSSSSECSPVQFHLSDEPMTRLPSPPARDSPSTPEPISVRMPTTPPALNGALKRTASAVSRKKSVYFADSVGKSLTEVQYIRSNKTDSNPSSSKELSFLVSSSLFSSSPPSYSKSDLYLPSSSLFEHKPWSFDVALSAKQYPPEKPLTRRFFCLYRQPNSEHPDIYLHEVWKRQVKLEHAEIPAHHSSTGEQYLIGTVWVTNAAFSKYVAVKYTFNRWLNSYESEAQYRRHSNDFRNLDLFEFHIDIPIDVDRVDFVLRYSVNGQEFWDNNDGQNYTLQTESAAIPSNTISLPHDCDFNEMRFY